MVVRWSSIATGRSLFLVGDVVGEEESEGAEDTVGDADGSDEMDGADETDGMEETVGSLEMDGTLVGFLVGETVSTWAPVTVK